MQEPILLQQHPKIEFQLHEDGFELIDGQHEQNSGFYAYEELRFVEVRAAWFPRLAQWLRGITYVLNGVPFFPNAESYKKAKLVIQNTHSSVGIWLTDTQMTRQAKKLEAELELRSMGW